MAAGGWRSKVRVVAWAPALVLAVACDSDAPASRTPTPGAPRSGAGAPTQLPAAGAAGTTMTIPNAEPEPTAPKPPSLPAGMFMPKADLDRDAGFDWEETVPGAGGCQPGTYTGTFTCAFVPLGAPPEFEPYPLTGPVSFTLEPSMDGEFLVIANGELEAIAEVIFGLRSKLAGKLDCNTLVLDAMAVEGRWALGDPNDSFLQGGLFEGELAGSLNPQTLQMTGTWALEDEAFGKCDGDWTASYVP
jgi:hypothetical protein